MRSVSRGLFLNAMLAVVVGTVSLAAAAGSHWAPPDGGDSGSRRGGSGRMGSEANGPPWSAGVSDQLPWPLFAVVAGLVVALTVRRLRPRTAFVAVVLATAGYLALGFPYGPVLLAPAVAVHSLASSLPLRTWVPMTTLLVPMLMAGYWDQPYFGLLDPGLYAGIVLGLTVSLVPALFGLLRRSRREAERFEHDQELRRVAVEERLRVAREVHDVVGHSLSVISLQAGVALHVLEQRPDQVAPSLEAIKRTSKDALQELRTTLELYRDSDGDGPRAPVPGLARLADLVAELAAAGRTVALLRDDQDQPPLPPTVDQAAYRIVQEALTNVVRHADGAATEVRIRRESTRLLVQVSNDGPVLGGDPPRAGHGIAGMTERARALGGSLTAGPDPGGGFAVRATLPIAAEPAARGKGEWSR